MIIRVIKLAILLSVLAIPMVAEAVEFNETPIAVFDAYPSAQASAVIQSIRFSPDLKHHAYAQLQASGQYRFVVDSRPVEGISTSSPGEIYFDAFGKPILAAQGVVQYDGSLYRYDSPMPGSIKLSDDRNHAAWIATNGKKTFVVLDGSKGKSYESIDPDSLTFSLDSAHIAYLAKNRGKCFAVVDENESKAYDDCEKGAIAFSQDSQKVAFAAKKFGNWLMVAGGEEGPRYDRVGKPVFGKKGDLAYPVRQGNKSFVMRNGQKGKEYDRILENSLLFSPQGNHLAYIAISQDKAFVVLDETKGMPFDEIAEGSPVFSPDGRHVAYRAKQHRVVFDQYAPVEQWVAVIDGQMIGPFEKIAPGCLVFSPDSKHFAFAAFKAAKWFVIKDGKKGRGYDWINHEMIAFSKTGHRLVYAAVEKGNAHLIINGSIKESYLAIIQLGGPIFNDTDSLHFLAIKDFGQNKKQLVLTTARF